MHSSIPQLNPEQEKAAEAPVSPLLIVAGAGTGKTRTLTSRIVHLIRSGMPPERILAITFTNKAAQEMMNRAAAMLSGGRAGGNPPGNSSRKGAPYISTFHSLGARILRAECRTFGREPNFVIFDDHDSFDLVKKAAKEIAPPKKFRGEDGVIETAREKKKKKEAPAFFARKISELKNLDGELDEEKSHVDEKKKNEASRVFRWYEDALRRNNAFDFDDLIEKPVDVQGASGYIKKISK